MNKNNFFKNTLVFIIVSLFFCVSVFPCISVISKKVKTYEIFDYQDKKSVTCYVFDRIVNGESDVVLSSDDFNRFYSIFKELNHMVAYDPFSEETRDLKVEFADLVDSLGMIPEDSSRDDVIRLMSPIFNGRKPLFSLPSNDMDGGRGSAFFCNFATFGEGSQFPVIILPRLIPILLFPIPRVIMRWDAVDGITSCGGLRSGKGFIAMGAQRGMALGFWGIGFSVFLPPVMSFGFIGYALFASATADEIELWPPNMPPSVSDENPLNDAMNVPVDLDELSFRINDEEGDMMNFTVTTNPNIGSGSRNQVHDGLYTVPVSGLNSNTGYTWSIVVSDGEDITEETFSFRTAVEAPFVADPVPSDGDGWVSVDLSKLSFRLDDLQGDLMDFTVETFPDIGKGSGSGVGNGFYSINIGNLDYSTDYTWFVNVTDGEYWTRRVFRFKTQPVMVFDPFEEGWHYRKQITIDHSKVAGDLVDFPVLINVFDIDLRDKAQFDGDDILFMNDSGVASRLFHEIELFDISSGKLIAWVNVSNLYSSTDTIFYIYYGNPSCNSQQYSTKTWDSNFKARYSMADLTVSMIKDSTINGFNGNKIGPDEPVVSSNGKIGDAQDYDGSDDFITIPNSLHLTGVHTISLWIKPASWTNYRAIFGGRGLADQTNKGGIAITSADGKIYYDVYDSAHRWCVVSNLPATDMWTLVTVTYDGNIIKMFFNGVEQTPSTTIGSITIDWAGSSWTRIGRSNNDLFTYFYGLIDEFRISNVGRNSQWILTEYYNQNDPTNFLSIGLEESNP